MGRFIVIHPLLLALAAYLSYSVKDVLLRLSMANLPFWSVQTVLYTVCALGLVVVALARRDAALLWPRNIRVALIAATLFLGSEGCWLYALPHAPLANLFVIVMLVPIIVLALGHFMLREDLSRRQLVAVLIAFAGASIMGLSQINTAGAGEWASYTACGGAVMLGAARTLYMRSRAQSERATGMIFVNALLGLAVCAPFGLSPLWQAQNLAVIPAGLGGLLDGFSLVVLAIALQRAKAASVQAVQYSQMLWSIIAGLMVWGEQPGPATLCGAALVVAAGIWGLRQPRAAS